MVSNMQLERCLGRGDDKMKNRSIKISVSIPLKLLEELDKITTYKGKSRSQYISGAVSQRLKARKTDNMDDLPITYLVSMLIGHDECPGYLRAILDYYVEGLQSDS